MSKARTVVLRTLLGAGIFIGAILLFIVGSIVFFRTGRAADFKDQAARMTALSTRGNARPSISLAADLSLPDDLPLNHVRMIATHNSYRKHADPLRMFFVGRAQPGEPARLDYAHPALTAQLDAGVRSFELDVRLRGDVFETTHVPLVDDRSTVPDLRLGLRELVLWSERNPGHVPLVLLFELKNDYTFLDPGLRMIDGKGLDRLDALLRDALGSRLLTPDDVRGGADALVNAIARRGWPPLSALRGRILAILHEDETYRLPYVREHPALEGRAMFTCAPLGSPDGGVAVIDDPVAGAAEIRERLARGWIVRTRADGDGVRGAAGLLAAISSGAQIVSTDFPPAYPAPDGYEASFGGGRMLAAGP
jgi:hypothetical protein